MAIRLQICGVEDEMDVTLEKNAPSDVSQSSSVPPAGAFDRRQLFQDDESFAAFGFLLKCCSHVARSEQKSPQGIKFVLPRTDGYVVKADFLEERLVGCELVEEVQNFCQPRQYVRAVSAEERDWLGISQILGQAVGGISLRSTASRSVLAELARLDLELEKRLSFPWLVKNPIVPKTVAYCDGRDRSSTLPVLTAAKALGIRMIVLDEPGHWLESLETSHLREVFVPTDLTVNDDLPMRIIQALESTGLQVDGLTTNWEPYIIPVAEAAAFLGLPCERLSAYDICRDKYQQQVLSGNPAIQVTRDKPLEPLLNGETEFPQVIKPSEGRNSEGVSKVNNQEDLVKAVDRIFNTDYDHISDINAINVEPYCDGPEIDANIVLQDGNALFVEIADDFPKAGDEDATGAAIVFKESAMVYPSGLPSVEQEMLKESLHQALIKFGFQNGVFHVEARVGDSTMEYRVDDGTLDLRQRSNGRNRQPSSSLVEVKPRLAGLMCNRAAACTSGVNYEALYLLFAIGDKEGVAALSMPFLGGPQYCSNVVCIEPGRGGELVIGDSGQDLRVRCPELWENVSSYHCLFEKVQRVPDPRTDEVVWLVWFVVFSREGRERLLELSERAWKEVRYELV
ncbi:MAG: hypothetical protein Q9174_003150 [Haloplaca sp. 1 TL-2023]